MVLAFTSARPAVIRDNWLCPHQITIVPQWMVDFISTIPQIRQGSYLAWVSAGCVLAITTDVSSQVQLSCVSRKHCFLNVICHLWLCSLPASFSMRMAGLCGEQCHMIYMSHLGLSTPQSVFHGLLFSSLYIGQLRVPRLTTSMTWRCFPDEGWKMFWSMSVAMQSFLPDFFHEDSLRKSKVSGLSLQGEA